MTAANLLPRRHFQSTLNFPPSSSLWQSSSKPTKPKDGKSSRPEYRHSFDNRTRLPARLDRHIAHPHRRREAPGRAACGNCPTVEVPAAKITIVETSAGQRSRCDGHKKGRLHRAAICFCGVPIRYPGTAGHQSRAFDLQVAIFSGSPGTRTTVCSFALRD